MTYRHSFSVEGAGEFPIDMLRYDCCYPRGEQDAAKIAVSVGAYSRARYMVHLERLSTAKSWRPSDGRWKSFGFDIVDDSVGVVRA